MENKYISLLLERCLSFKKSKSLFISYDKVNKKFVEKLINYAKKMGINDIVFDEEDIFLTHQKLSTETIEEIEKDPYFNKKKWDEYAKKDACFLMLETEFPHVMDDIEPSRIAKARFMNRSTVKFLDKKKLAMKYLGYSCSTK